MSSVAWLSTGAEGRGSWLGVAGLALDVVVRARGVFVWLGDGLGVRVGVGVGVGFGLGVGVGVAEGAWWTNGCGDGDGADETWDECAPET